MFKKLSSRKFKMGAYASAVSAVLVVLLIAVNIVSVLLTDRAGAFVDLTASGAFRVSEEIMDVFRDIRTPLSVTVLYGEEDYKSMNPYCAQVEYILSEAQRVNENIRVRYVDPIRNPEIRSGYPQLACTQGDMIIENEDSGRAFELLFSDLFFIANNQITASKAEAVIASRLVSMQSGKSFPVAFTSGHGEDEMQGLTDLLLLNNYTVETVSTVTEAIPADCLCLIIAGPDNDFSAEEIRGIEQFLLNGGEYGKSLLYFASMDKLELPNLEGLLSAYGIGISDDVVAETNTNYVYGEKNAYALSGYTEQDYAARAITAGLYSISPYTRPLDLLFQTSGDMTVLPLMCFSPSAVAVNPLEPEKIRYGNEEDLYSALVCENTHYIAGEGARTSRVCAFGTVFFADDTMLSTESLGNAEYLIGVMSKLAPNEISIEVASKSILGGYMSITANAAKWLGITFIGILPAIVIAAGIFVYVRRRNR